VGIEGVAVVEVDFFDRGLGNKVEDVRTGATEADNCDLGQGQLAGQETDPCAARRRIQVPEDRLFFAGRDDWEGLCRRSGVDRLRPARDHVYVARDFGVVVGVTLRRLAREDAVGDQPLGDLGRALAVDDVRELGAAIVTRNAARERDHVSGRPDRGRATGRQLGDDGPISHLPGRGHVGNVFDEEVVGEDLDFVALVLEAQEVGLRLTG